VVLLVVGAVLSVAAEASLSVTTSPASNEPAAALLAAAGQARTQADADLAALRARVLAERTTALTAVDTLAQRLATLREQQLQAEQELSLVRAANERTRLAQAAAALLAQQQLQQAAHLLNLSNLPTDPAARTTVITTALSAEPARLAAAAQLVRANESVQDRTGHALVVPVVRLGAARAWAAGDTPETSGAVVTQAGLAVITGPPLHPEQRSALADPAQVLLDVSGTWATQVAPLHRSLGEWLRGGRTFIWPILSVGVLGLILALLRTVALSRCRPSRPTLDRAVAWFNGERTVPLSVDAAQPLGRVLAVGVATLGLPREAREAALDRAVLAEAPQLQRGLGILLLLASIAPLLGLLGTVTGMIDLFSVIGAQGSGNARALSGGISEALITTQAGMLVAVPLLVAHSLLNRAAERRLFQLEEAASAALVSESASGAGGTAA
jgi:biopolymer transport protein ExbB